jgi:glycosyltransferase involved in cell wall biosynthesis
VFVLELVRRISEIAPETQFVLLTQAGSHEELGSLDRKNVRRVMVVGASPRDVPVRRDGGTLGRALRHVPDRFRRVIARAASIGIRTLKRFRNRSRIQEIAADLLFCPFTAPTYFDRDVPTVCTIYDLQYKTYPYFFAPEEIAQRDRTFLDACRHANALVAISDYSRDSAILHGRLPANRIRTIHLRMAHRIASPQETDAPILSRLGLVAERYLLYPANFWKHKNHEMLLTAFGMARAQGLPEDIKLVCTGAPGERRDWLMRAAVGLGLAEHVAFPGYLSDAEMSVVMANAKGVIFPSLYEGFGLPVVEAMAAGIPVACSNITALPEVADDAALLFNPKIPADITVSILSLVLDEAIRERCVAAGRARASEFSDSQHMAEEYWSVLRGAVAAHRSAVRRVRSGS